MSESNYAVFTSMGMFIIDEIHFPKDSGKESQYNVIGGGGTYGAFGSRMITTRRHSKRVGLIIDKGKDFPEEVGRYIEGWNTSIVWRDTPERLTTRGWNLYGERDFREFKYLTPKKRITVQDLADYPHLLNSESFHLICSPERSIQILSDISRLRNKDLQKPVIVWEPVPDLCVPENLAACLSVLPNLNVLTPNAEEAARFFNEEEPVTKEELEDLAQKFIGHLSGDSSFKTGSGIVLRCGALGCHVLTSRGLSKWFPAYHNEHNPQRKVVDPTGGGNSFIGGFTTGFIMSRGDWEVAAICGNLVAGAAIEQIGMPKFENDKWNGLTLSDRLERYITYNSLQISADSVMESLDCSA